MNPVAVHIRRPPPGLPWRFDTSDAPTYEQTRPMADHECTHGRLPFDPSPACGCWHAEPVTATILTADHEPAAWIPPDRAWLATLGIIDPEGARQ